MLITAQFSTANHTTSHHIVSFKTQTESTNTSMVDYCQRRAINTTIIAAINDSDFSSLDSLEIFLNCVAIRLFYATLKPPVKNELGLIYLCYDLAAASPHHNGAVHTSYILGPGNARRTTCSLALKSAKLARQAFPLLVGVEPK